MSLATWHLSVVSYCSILVVAAEFILLTGYSVKLCFGCHPPAVWASVHHHCNIAQAQSLYSKKILKMDKWSECLVKCGGFTDVPTHKSNPDGPKNTSKHTLNVIRRQVGINHHSTSRDIKKTIPIGYVFEKIIHRHLHQDTSCKAYCAHLKPAVTPIVEWKRQLPIWPTLHTQK